MNYGSLRTLRELCSLLSQPEPWTALKVSRRWAPTDVFPHDYPGTRQPTETDPSSLVLMKPWKACNDPLQSHMKEM